MKMVDIVLSSLKMVAAGHGMDCKTTMDEVQLNCDNMQFEVNRRACTF
jgi:hypothetical protein